VGAERQPLPSKGARITLAALPMTRCRTVTWTRRTRSACVPCPRRRRIGIFAGALMLLLALEALAPRVAAARPPRPAPASDADEKKPTPWGASIAAGLSASTGKDNVFTSSVDAKVKYDARPHKVKFDLNSFFSIKNNRTDADRSFVGLEYRYFWSEPTFTYGQASAEQNQQQNLSFRTTWVGGVGRTVTLHEDPTFFLQEGKITLQGGTGYQYQDLHDPAATVITHRWIVQAGAGYNAIFKRNVRWNNRLLFVVPPLDVDEWRTIYTSDLKLPLIGNLTFLTNLTLDYLNGPVLEVRQNQKLTFFASVGLSYAFGSEVDR
jgi:putative salt-induced outer membrane protein YdiY